MCAEPGEVDRGVAVPVLPGPFEFIGSLLSSTPKPEPCNCHQPAQPRKTATERANWFLLIAGGTVLLGAFSFFWHLFLIAAGLIAATLGASMALRKWRRRRLAVRVVPAPLPAAPPRTVVESVHVQAIEQPTQRPALRVVDGKARQRSR